MRELARTGRTYEEFVRRIKNSDRHDRRILAPRSDYIVAWLGIRDLADFQYVRPAELFSENCSHEKTSVGFA